jgi:Ras-related protein Rab-23
MFITDGHEEDLEISIKVVIVGNGAVGKSSLIQRYCRGTFTKSYKKTIGVDFLEKHLRISGEDVRLMLWDTAGQEEFDAITKAYYRGAQACVVAFASNDRASFEAVDKWKRKVEEECGGIGMGNIPMVLVQNKIDLMHQSLVSTEEVDRYAKANRMRVYRTSVKEDINVGNVFQHLAENYVQRIRMEQDLMRFDIGGGPRSLSIQINGNNEVDRVCNGSTSSNSSNSSGSTGSSRIFANRKFSSNSSSGYFSLTNFGTGNNDHSDTRALMSYTPHQYTTPQEYLNNPMFESLNNHKRLGWPSVIGNGSDRTITLKPLNVLKRKKSKTSLQKRLGLGIGTSSSNSFATNYQYPPPPLSGRSSTCKVL